MQRRKFLSRSMAGGMEAGLGATLQPARGAQSPSAPSSDLPPKFTPSAHSGDIPLFAAGAVAKHTPSASSTWTAVRRPKRM